jgi:hypothetical protein
MAAAAMLEIQVNAIKWAIITNFDEIWYTKTGSGFKKKKPDVVQVRFYKNTVQKQQMSKYAE